MSQLHFFQILILRASFKLIFYMINRFYIVFPLIWLQLACGIIVQRIKKTYLFNIWENFGIHSANRNYLETFARLVAKFISRKRLFLDTSGMSVGKILVSSVLTVLTGQNENRMCFRTSETGTRAEKWVLSTWNPMLKSSKAPLCVQS